MDKIKKIAGWIGIGFLCFVAAAMFIPGPEGDASGRPVGYVFLAIIAAILGYKYFMPKAAKSVKTKLDLMSQEAMTWAEAVQGGKAPPVDTLGMIVPRGETAYLCENAQLAEVTTKRTTAGVGTRVKIGNMPFYVGGSEGFSRKEMTQSDSGIVMLTDKSLIFVGSLRTVHFSLGDVVKVAPSFDVFTLNVRGRVSPIALAVRNPLLWSGAISTFAKG